MVEAKPILRTAVGVSSVALLGRAVQMVPKKWVSKKKVKPKKQTKKMISGFMDLTVGTAMLRPTASIVESY